MKWLIILTFLACGKNKTPPLVLIEASPLAATQMTQVTGQVRYIHDKKPYSFDLHANRDWQTEAMELLVQSSSPRKRAFFQEKWLTFSLSLPDTQAALSLTFDLDVKGVVFELALIDDYRVKVLNEGTDEIVLKLSTLDLSHLASGKRQIAIRKKESSPSKEHFVIGEGVVTILANRNETDFATDVSQINLFTDLQPSAQPQWWVKEISPSLSIAVFTSASELNEIFRKNLRVENFSLSRENGNVVKAYSLTKSHSGNVHFKVRGSLAIRTFETKKEVTVSGADFSTGSTYQGCVHQIRYISSENSSTVTLDDLISHFFIEVDGSRYSLAHPSIEVSEDRDESGPFWNIQLKMPGNKVGLKLEELTSGFQTVGLFQSSCANPLSTSRLHPEAKLSLEIEALVEKLE